MTTLGGFTKPPGPAGPDLPSKLATATGLAITDATADQTQAYVTGTISEANRAAIQSAINAYVLDTSYGLTLADTFTINGAQPLVWTNMPLALTAAAGTLAKLPLYNARFARLTVNVTVTGSTNAVLIAQVSTDGVSYTSGPQVSVFGTGLKVSSLVAISPQFQTDCFFRMAGSGGDGVADPAFGMITVQIA